MGKKKLQGADGINFQMQLTIKGLETVTFPKETLTNESGKDIAWIECLSHLSQDKIKQKFIENWNPTTRSVNIYDM